MQIHSTTISGTSTTAGLNVTSFLNALLAYIDTLTTRVLVAYTATVGSLTATSTANLYGGTQTSTLTAMMPTVTTGVSSVGFSSL